MALKFIIVSALLLVAIAHAEDSGYTTGAPKTPAKYSFNYQVEDPDSKNDFGHQEARDGPEVQGAYEVNLPDGRTQKVSYTVSVDSGYVANVEYDGVPQYPDETHQGYA